MPAGDLVTQLNESLRDRGVAEGIQSFLYNVALSISRYDKDSHILPSYLIGQNTCAVYATTTKPECDAHLVKGSATTRARVRSAHRRHHRRHRRAARRRAGTPEAAATPTEEHRRRPVVPGPAGALLDTVTGELGKLTKRPPPSVPTTPAPPPPPPGVEHVLDYLLGK